MSWKHLFPLGAETGCARITGHANSETTTAVPTEGASTTCEVPLQALDSFCEQQVIAQIDILKIDVGSHDSYGRGAAKLGQTGRIRSGYIEMTFEHSDPIHTLFDLVRANLAVRRFAFSGLYEPRHHPEGRGRIGFANALFCCL